MQKNSTQSERSTSSLADTHASHSAEPASSEAILTTAISGQQCLKSSDASGRLGSLERMLLVMSAWASTKCFLTWKEKTTKQGHLLFRLAPSTPLKDAIGVGFWPTPRAAEAEGGGSEEHRADQRLLLQEEQERSQVWSEIERRGLLRRWDKTQSPVRGMVDGVPDWVDRVKSLGNAVVPQIPEIIGRLIMEIENDQDLLPARRV